ncbi:MFS transporter [Protaetiibacter sp. SSC-01]|uniref:MFS transporter n=1 Tax=Protaetiibacter sp. SSC-01 TaxID=2759943 RepID=UPI0016573D14|nr:MFS transporter [Protaetiibacter sp. SSC-01]QNO37519.1 MFS transporter [Protaetiibacter sp. SSC-01]
MPSGVEPITQASRTARLAPGAVPAGLFLVYAAVFVGLAAVSVVYLPRRVAELAPDDKLGLLALVTTASSLVVMLAQPIIGMLSDRTRGSLGRRLPWMIAGAVSAGVLLPSMGLAGGAIAIGLLWVGVELSLNVVLAPAAAATVDLVPERRRGLVAGVTGAGFLAGSALGASVVGGMMLSTALGLWTAAVLPLLGVAAFAVLTRARTPAPPSAARARVRAGFATAVRELSARPDFAWAFLSRALVTLAHSVLVTYLLYIAEDHLGLAADEADAFAGLLVAVILAASLPTLLLGGILSDRTGRRRGVVAATTLAMAASLIIPLTLRDASAMLVFAAVFGLAYGAYTSSAKALNTLVLSDGERRAGRDLGVLNIAAILPQVVAPGVAWLVVSATGGYGALFAVSLVLAALGAVAILRVRSVR